MYSDKSETDFGYLVAGFNHVDTGGEIVDSLGGTAVKIRQLPE